MSVGSSGDTNRNSTKLSGRATAKGRWGQMFVDDAGLRCCASVVAKPRPVEYAGAVIGERLTQFQRGRAQKSVADATKLARPAAAMPQFGGYTASWLLAIARAIERVGKWRQVAGISLFRVTELHSKEGLCHESCSAY